MKTIDDFYAKWGTGSNYDMIYQIMLHAKKSSDNYLREKYDEFENDFTELFEHTFDETLFRDYNYLLNY